MQVFGETRRAKVSSLLPANIPRLNSECQILRSERWCLISRPADGHYPIERSPAPFMHRPACAIAHRSRSCLPGERADLRQRARPNPRSRPRVPAPAIVYVPHPTGSLGCTREGKGCYFRIRVHPDIRGKSRRFCIHHKDSQPKRNNRQSPPVTPNSSFGIGNELLAQPSERPRHQDTSLTHDRNNRRNPKLICLKLSLGRAQHFLNRLRLS